MRGGAAPRYFTLRKVFLGGPVCNRGRLFPSAFSLPISFSRCSAPSSVSLSARAASRLPRPSSSREGASSFGLVLGGAVLEPPRKFPRVPFAFPIFSLSSPFLTSAAIQHSPARLLACRGRALRGKGRHLTAGPLRTCRWSVMPPAKIFSVRSGAKSRTTAASIQRCLPPPLSLAKLLRPWSIFGP